MSQSSPVEIVEEDDHRETAEALTLISFERALIRSFKNTVVKQKNIIHNYGHGLYCGAAEEVDLKEGCWEKKRTVGCLKFDDCENAKRWFDSDPLIKQQDWLGTSNVYVIPLTRPLPCGFSFVAMMNLKISDKHTFFCSYKPKHQKLVEEHGGMTRIAGTCHTAKLRGGPYLKFTIIDLFKSKEDFEKFYTSTAYQEIKEYRTHSATGDVMGFNLSIDV